MLVLVSFGLVLVATILLVLGLLSDDGLLLIYLSIAGSAAAALVLVLALKRTPPRAEAPASGPEPPPITDPDPATPTSGEGQAADQDTRSADDEAGQEGDEVELRGPVTKPTTGD